VDELREACAEVAERAVSVRIMTGRIEGYAAELALAAQAALEADQSPAARREQRLAFWLTLDAINFGSGWFPTLRKPAGRSGYSTIAAALSQHYRAEGPWSAQQLARLTPRVVAGVLGQDAGHPLMTLFAASLNDLGRRLSAEAGGEFAALIDAADRSAVALAGRVGGWECFADCSRYQELEVPFLKRAQIAAADVARAGLAEFGDLERLTMFADNLVPHVLRLDGVLAFSTGLVERIERGELIEHGSPEEVEIRACALHAVELIVAAQRAGGRPARAMDIDQRLWQRGQEPRYKASPRHRSRCTAY
jgi:hypothetical protein